MASQGKPHVYQIDFTAVASGKRVASSKRRVRWRFGFASPEALAAGETGTACRGEEHDVTLVWSVTSGKRLILADGQEVHYSSSRNGIFDFSWTMRGNHVLKIVAHASPPMAPTPGWRQYDFFVDGQSFFIFPKVYRLGLAVNDPRAHAPGKAPARLAEKGNRYKGPPEANGSNGIANLEAPTNSQEEEAYLQAAIDESMKDAQGMKPPSNSSGDYGDLLDFGSVAPDPVHNDALGGGGSPAALPPSTTPAPAAYPPPAQAADPFAGYAAPAPPQAALALAAPTSGGYGYAAPANGGPYGAPAGSFGGPERPPPSGPPPINTQHSNGMGPPGQVTPQAQQTPSTIGFQSPPADFGFSSPAPEEKPAAAPPADSTAQSQLTMNSLSGQGGLLGDGKPAAASGSMADQAYARLAMMDSFTLGAQPTKAQNPFDAATGVNNNVVGGNKTLADMKANKDGPGGSKEIMKAAPNSMVVSGNQSAGWGGYGAQQPPSQMGGMYGQPPPQTPSGQQPQSQMGGMYGQPQMGGMMQQPQMVGMTQQPQMGGMMQQPQMGGATQQPQMGGTTQKPFGQQAQMGQPGQYPPPLQQQPFGAAYGYPPATQG
eukprot:CAMPEP_0198142492 /NCGR_PEP_ID=MMETSP1443-20131203/5261_1 /TAXON_ID=186043 /ORGANISM="Entomoneis sp., Strain CCMP2396" /LENGTH=599 /DNA_ID=CAMNT_0043805511 /DNA_START=386 /DNA_END=2185 /DNA_ORIENTATION=-